MNAENNKTSFAIYHTFYSKCTPNIDEKLFFFKAKGIRNIHFEIIYLEMSE